MFENDTILKECAMKLEELAANDPTNTNPKTGKEMLKLWHRFYDRLEALEEVNA